jgi:hypothetical protein
MKMTNKRCKDCKYFISADYEAMAKNPRLDSWSMCRRFPKWERIGDDNYCGEFKPLKSK